MRLGLFAKSRLRIDGRHEQAISGRGYRMWPAARRASSSAG